MFSHPVCNSHNLSHLLPPPQILPPLTWVELSLYLQLGCWGGASGVMFSFGVLRRGTPWKMWKPTNTGNLVFLYKLRASKVCSNFLLALLLNVQRYKVRRRFSPSDWCGHAVLGHNEPDSCSRNQWVVFNPHCLYRGYIRFGIWGLGSDVACLFFPTRQALAPHFCPVLTPLLVDKEWRGARVDVCQRICKAVLVDFQWCSSPLFTKVTQLEYLGWEGRVVKKWQ